MRARFTSGAAALCVSIALSPPMLCQRSSAAAETALLAGRVADAEAMLRADLSAHPDDSRAHLLLCRVFYAQDRFEDAEPEAELAAETPGSESQLWLGRVYGARAARANPLHAFALARKVRTAFERAVELDPNNLAALSDLGEFYVEAPAIVGGGLEKARLLVPRLAARNAVAGDHLRGLIAKKDGDVAAAQRAFEAAAASKSPAGLIDLAIFRVEQKQPDLAVAAVHQAIDADHSRDSSLVDAASLLTRLQREPRLAANVLRDYLTSPAISDAAPAFKVRLQLAAILRTLGDSAGAEHEVALADALAPSYASARKRKLETGS